MKMEPIVSSETSAIRTQTPGNYPKMNKLQVSYSLHTSDISEETGINWTSVSAIYRPYKGRMFKLGKVCLFVSLARQPPQVCHGLRIHEDSISHTTTHLRQ